MAGTMPAHHYKKAFWTQAMKPLENVQQFFDSHRVQRLVSGNTMTLFALRHGGVTTQHVVVRIDAKDDLIVGEPMPTQQALRVGPTPSCAATSASTARGAASCGVRARLPSARPSRSTASSPPFPTTNRRTWLATTSTAWPVSTRKNPSPPVDVRFAYRSTSPNRTPSHEPDA